jgi:hypothetical protein
MRTLRQLQLDNCGLPFLFLSERGKLIAINTGRNINLGGDGITASSTSSIDTGDGNNIITAIGNYYVLYNLGTINTGNGNDSIIADIAEKNGSLPLYISINSGTIDTGNNNDSIIFHARLSNGGGVFLGDGNDSLLADAGSLYPALMNEDVIETGDGNDIITSTGVIYNQGIINTGKGNDSIIVDRGVDGTGTGYGIYNNGGSINTGEGNDSIIASEGFESGENSSGSVFLGKSKDYIKGFGSGDFYGGNGNDFTG